MNNMEKFYTKKSFLIMFIFSILFLGIGICYAASSETYKTISSVADFSFIEPTVKHEAIPTVLANGKLNAKVSVTFGEAKAANIYLEYKLDSDTNISTVSIKNVASKREYYLATPDGLITEENTSIEYRIVGEFTIEGEPEPYYAYAPTDASSTTFVTADVISVIEEENVNGSDGAEIKVFSGDQSKGDEGYVIVSVPKGAYDGTHKVTVDFLEDISYADSSSSGKRETVISAVSVDVDSISELKKAIAIKNLPLQNETKANKFSLQFFDGAEWKTVPKSGLSVDKKNQTYSFSADTLGVYRVLETIALSDSSYRPSNRIVVKNKIPGSYPGFEFKYLKEGDKVKIYNLKGKKIAELNSGSSDGFVWEGKKGTNNSGDWVESGTYIYQIKLKDGGDVISGTIAFVW